MSVNARKHNIGTPPQTLHISNAEMEVVVGPISTETHLSTQDFHVGSIAHIFKRCWIQRRMNSCTGAVTLTDHFCTHAITPFWHELKPR